MSRVVVVGGGIAGVEAALTIARTNPRASITLVAQWPSMRIVPELVYVPFGVVPQAIDVRLIRALAADGIELHLATCQGVDIQAHELHLSTGTLSYDSVVFAPGTVPQPTSANRLRTLDDADRLRSALAELEQSTARHRAVTLRVPEECHWTPPAFEFALLLARWRSTIGAPDIRIEMAIEASEPLDIFSFEASELVRTRLHEARVELMSHIPAHRIDLIPSSLAIEFDGLVAQRVFGLPPLQPSGFYRTDSSGRVATDAYVVGDATEMPFKAGFAVGWHARRVAAALGGDITLLGSHVDGIPIGDCEYQMDLADGTSMHVRFDMEHHFHEPYLTPVADVFVRDGAPEKLAGTLVRTLLVDGLKPRQVDVSARTA